MTRIDHSFRMSGDPAAAQELFMRDVVPELARDAFFHVIVEEPGHLEFDDALSSGGTVSRMGVEDAPGNSVDEAELSDAPNAATQFAGGRPRLAGRAAAPATSVGQDLLARHLRVEFTPGDGDTIVRMHGRVRKNLRVALERFGGAGHWPETADQPHD